MRLKIGRKLIPNFVCNKLSLSNDKIVFTFSTSFRGTEHRKNNLSDVVLILWANLWSSLKSTKLSFNFSFSDLKKWSVYESLVLFYLLNYEHAPNSLYFCSSREQGASARFNNLAVKKIFETFFFFFSYLLRNFRRGT